MGFSKAFIAISFLLAFLLVCQPIPVFAAESGDATVDDLFQKENEKEPVTDADKNENKGQPAEQGSASVTAMDFIRMIGALLFVIFLIYAVVKLLNKRNKLIRPFQYIENMGGTSLGHNRSVQLIKVGKRVMVVGVGESIQLLKEIENEEERQAILDQYEETIASKMELPKWLDQIKGRITTETEPSQTFADSLKKELKKLKSLRNEGMKKGIRNNE